MRERSIRAATERAQDSPGVLDGAYVGMGLYRLYIICELDMVARSRVLFLFAWAFVGNGAWEEDG